MKDSSIQNMLAHTMLYGVALAAGVMLVGGAIYLKHDGSLPMGDHLFQGEPMDLTKPADIAMAAWHGNTRSVIQIGVLLLLANPFVRTLFSIFGFGVQKDWLYTVISLLVLTILGISFFY